MSLRTSPVSTSGLEELRDRHFQGYLVEVVGSKAFGMAVFAGPAKPLLSLNPQEEAKFQKEVAQVRRRATKVSGCRRPTAKSESPGPRGIQCGSLSGLASPSSRFCYLQALPVWLPTSRAWRPRLPRRKFMLIGK